MITDQLEEWKLENDICDCECNEDLLYSFLNSVYRGKNFLDLASMLAYAIHELEVCVNGLIEDMEYANGQKNKEIKKENR